MRRALAAAAVCALTACGSTVQVTGTSTTSPDGLGGLGGSPAASSGAGTTTTGSSSLDGGGTSGAGTTTGAVSAISGTSGAVPSGTTSGGQGTAPGLPAAGSIPAKGPGWDARTVYLGVTTQQDVQTVAQSAGINSVDSGNQQADVEAVIADYNEKGGLFGRRIQAIYFDVKSAGNADTQAQAACAAFTQDHHVVAVYAAALVSDTPAFRTCMANARVPVLAGGGQAFDDKVFIDLKGWYHLMPFPSWSRFAPAFVDRLVAQGYFSGWSTTAGKPGAAPGKVGFLCPDTPIGHRVGARISQELARVGHKPTDETYYSTSNADVTGYVLRFKTDGITHVLMCDLGLFVFAEQAESQHYRPRYGVSTFNTPVLFLQGVVPDAQLSGAVGSGFDPTLDVDDARDAGAGAFPAAARCRALASKHGVSYAADRRFARGVLYDTCDIIGLIVASAKRVNALDGASIKLGIGLEGKTLQPAVTFVSGLSSSVHALPAATRDIFFEDGCRCFRYRGVTRPMG